MAAPMLIDDIRAVTFDLDDTLWCGKLAIRRANEHFHAFLQQRLPAVSASFPPSEFDKLMLQFQSSLPEHAHNYTFLRKHTLRHCMDQVGLTALGLMDEAAADAILEEAFQAFLIPRSQPQFFAGIEELLEELHVLLEPIHASEGTAVPMGVITNGNCRMDLLPEYFRNHMQFVVSAELAGVAKPAPQIFDAALRHLPAHVDRSHVVHVGDHYECDVVGAKKAGMRAIWVNAKWSKPSVFDASQLSAEERQQFGAADAIVRDVTEIPAVITWWNRNHSGRTHPE